MIEKQKALEIIVQQISQLPRDHESEIALHSLQQAYDQIYAMPSEPKTSVILERKRDLLVDRMLDGGNLLPYMNESEAKEVVDVMIQCIKER